MAGEQRLILTLQTQAGRIAGRLADEDGSTVEFAGWLELASALGRLMGSEPPRPAIHAPIPHESGGRDDHDPSARRPIHKE